MRYEYIIADSIVPTFEFDVISTETREQVTINDVATKPVMDFTLFPSGLGFQQEVDVVEGDTIDYVLKQTLKKKTIKITLMWKGANAYYRYNNFLKWLARYLDLDKYHVRFSYVLTNRRYVELAVTNLELKGRDDYMVSAELTAQPLSPFYEETMLQQIINDTNSGKIYNYVYPYVYGGGVYSDDNTINNEYLKAVPLKVILYGPITNPAVAISSVSEDGTVGDVYGQVQFQTGLQIYSNEKIVIDAFNNRIYKETENTTTGTVVRQDLFHSVDKSFNSFLFAEPGLSKISASIESDTIEGTTGDTTVTEDDKLYSACEVHWVRYIL